MKAHYVVLWDTQGAAQSYVPPSGVESSIMGSSPKGVMMICAMPAAMAEDFEKTIGAYGADVLKSERLKV